MRILSGLALLCALAACGDTDLERGVTGAAIGATTATVYNANPVTGAIVGGAIGVVSDEIVDELR
ncbi:MAG: hypothetical protein AAGA32_00390 [Pseudomonadota bacterium]